MICVCLDRCNGDSRLNIKRISSYVSLTTRVATLITVGDSDSLISIRVDVQYRQYDFRRGESHVAHIKCQCFVSVKSVMT